MQRRDVTAGTSVAKTLTWIVQPEDFDPPYVAKIEAKLGKLFRDVAARFDFSFRFVNAHDVVPLCDGLPRLLYKGEDLLAAEPQCFLVDESSWNAQSGHFLQAIYRTIVASGSVLLNRSITGPDYLERDKLAMMHRAASLNIRTAATVAVPPGRFARSVLPVVQRIIGDGPYILKPRELGMGISVLKTDTMEQLRSALDIAAQSGIGYIVQPFISNQGDCRVYMLDGNIVGSQLRLPPQSGYLANISQGGSGQPAPDLTPVRQQCCRIAEDLQATYLCVDWLMTEEGPVLNEWGTALAGFSGLPEPDRTAVADVFMGWVKRSARLGTQARGGHQPTEQQWELAGKTQ